jgi:hypothetical protein
VASDEEKVNNDIEEEEEGLVLGNSNPADLGSTVDACESPTTEAHEERVLLWPLRHTPQGLISLVVVLRAKATTELSCGIRA